MRFPPEEAHHILQVIRLRAGDCCRVVDGRGGRYVVRIEAARDQLVGRVVDARKEPESARVLELGFPTLRMRGRTEWLLEKSVEVGVNRLVPILWSRSVRRELAHVRTRWERILQEAMKQSGRAWLPVLAEEEEIAPGDPDACWILADPQGGSDPPDLSGHRRVRLLVGPEGGPTPEERAALIQQGAVLWALGSTRLRSETASIVGSHRLACLLQALAGTPIR